MTLLNRQLEQFVIDSLNWASDSLREDLQEETFEVIKGDNVTVIKMYFNKRGIPVKQKVVTKEVEKDLSTLEKELKEAIDKLDFEIAIKIRDKMKSKKGSQ